MRQVLGYLSRGSCSAGLISVVSESACKITRFYITEQDLTIKRLNKMHFYRNFLVFFRFSEQYCKGGTLRLHLISGKYCTEISVLKITNWN